jgi:hypothetical protein
VLTRLLVAFALMAACVVLHASGLTLAMRWMMGTPRHVHPKNRRHLSLLIMVAGWTVLIHLTEISLWALYYTLVQAMPDIDAALYFSAVTYTTTGYGDLVLPAGWRLVGGIEALTGILMCGWSTGFFFAIFNEMFFRRAAVANQAPQEEEP